MFISTKNAISRSISAVAFATVCSGCEALNPDLSAAAQPQSVEKTLPTKKVPHSSGDPVKQNNPPTAKPIRAAHPGRLHISLDEAGQALRVEVTYAQCGSGFLYDHNTLEIHVDPSDRSITLTGSVNYIEPVSNDESACSIRPEPIVFISEDYEPEAYVIKNMSAWMGRAGNGIKGRVIDFRTPERVERDKQDCLVKDQADISDISGIWFLDSNPSTAMALSGSEATLVPESILRTWVGSTVPWIIEADAPYTFTSSPFGRIEFRSSTCALVYHPLTGDQTDFLFRQTPESL